MTLFHRRRIRRAQEARQRAQERLAAAEARRDTQAISAARKALAQATNALLRVEVRA